MKKTLFVVSVLSLMASAVMAADSRSLRSLIPSALTPGVLGQPTPISPSLDPQPSPTLDLPAPTPTTTYYTPTPTTVPPTTTTLSPVPETYAPVAQPCELFCDVRYHGKCNIAPCAVPTIIQVADPCSKRSCCKTCVNVEICVPPCDPCCVKVTRDGHCVRYDFGKYAVVAKTVGNHVVVRYID